MKRAIALTALMVPLAGCGTHQFASGAVVRVASSRDGTPKSAPARCDRPPPRAAASLSFDGETLLLLGGGDYEGHYFQDEWSWRGHGWRCDTISPIPPARAGPASVWNPRTSSVVMVGGTFPNTGVDPSVGRVTWVRQHGRWTAHHPRHVQPDMAEAGLVYDPDVQQVLLIGGAVNWARDGTEQQVWSWDGHDWRKRSALSAPPGRFGAAVAFDPVSHDILLFGGHMGLPDQLDETWAYDGKSWRQLHPATVPSAGDAVAATDTTHHRVVLVTTDGSTWIWTGDNWQRATSPQSPPPELFAAISDDPPDRGIALVTGKAYTPDGRETLPGELWLWDGRQWKLAGANA